MCLAGHGFGICRDDVDHTVVIVAEVAERPAASPRSAPSDVQQDDALAGNFSRSVSSFSCCAGVIGFQSPAQRSAPKHGDATLLQDLQRGGRRSKIEEAKER